MSGPTHKGHEGFQGLIAEGARLKGAVVLPTSTMAPADLVIFPVVATEVPPLIVEVKTSKRDRWTVLDGEQALLQRVVARRAHGASHVILTLLRTPHRPKGQSSGEITYDIDGSRAWEKGTVEHRIFQWLADCYEQGRTAQLARKGLVRADGP